MDHVVAEIIEAKFVVGAVGDVGGVGLLPRDATEVLESIIFFPLLYVLEIEESTGLVAHTRVDHSDREPQEQVGAAVPPGVAPSEIIVDGNDMDAFAGQGADVASQGGRKGLAFPGFLLGNATVVEGKGGQELDVVGALTGHAADGFSDSR
jgi:hypothetical protein